MYARVFEQHHEGRVILDALVRRFCRDPYVAGGHEGDRETCRRVGQFSVVNFINQQINLAHGETEEESES